jgi:hypothetical protein
VIRERRPAPVFHFPDQHEIPVQKINKGISADLFFVKLF